MPDVRSGQNRLRVAIAENHQALADIEKQYRQPEGGVELIPYAMNTSYTELAEHVFIERGVKHPGARYHYPLCLCTSTHNTVIGSRTLCQKTREYLRKEAENVPIDILSISAHMEDNHILLVFLVRVYLHLPEDQDQMPHFRRLYRFLGEKTKQEDTDDIPNHLIIPKGHYYHYTEEEKEIHEKEAVKQHGLLVASTEEKPFLNQVSKYVPEALPTKNEKEECYYSLKAQQKLAQMTILDYDSFTKIFEEMLAYVTTVEVNTYFDVLRGRKKKKELMDVIEVRIKEMFIRQRKVLPNEDFPILMKKLDNALFQLYIVQELINDPEITDIKITAPDEIRVRIKGKAYLSDVTFFDANDYLRFIHALAIKNNIDPGIPSQTFTDESDPEYILRFSLTAGYITPTGMPIIHIRKVSRKKLLADDLIQAGMFDEKIRDYLLDCGKHSKGVIFAGPPGSGKTVCLNWFLEDAYPAEAEILVIQENDELFTYRKGVMFEHVVRNPRDGEYACSLEDLGQMALVAGANVFIIGEVKGPEICSAITLANSGCRTALTIHSQSSTDAIDKMVELELSGRANINYEQAKRLIKSFQTIVYLEDFQIKEITEITGYDEKRKDMVYRPIYRADKEEESIFTSEMKSRLMDARFGRDQMDE